MAASVFILFYSVFFCLVLFLSGENFSFHVESVFSLGVKK